MKKAIIPVITFFIIMISCMPERQNVLTAEDTVRQDNGNNEKPPYDAPAGFKWLYVKESSSWFGVPDGWKYKKEKNENVTGLYLVKATKKYLARLTVNIIPKVKNPTVYVDDIHSNFIGKNKPVETSLNIKGLYLIKKTVIKNNDAGMNLHMILTTYINRSTNTVYLVLYEAPENEWKNDRNTVNVFIKNMKFNDKY